MEMNICRYETHRRKRRQSLERIQRKTNKTNSRINSIILIDPQVVVNNQRSWNRHKFKCVKVSNSGQNLPILIFIFLTAIKEHDIIEVI